MIADIDRRIARALGRIRQAFRMVIGQADSAPGIQLAGGDALAGETVEAAELMQHYGLTSVPPAGTQAVVIPLGGATSHGVIVATEHASYRLVGLETGEVALYTDERARIVLRRGRLIEVDCDTFRVTCKDYEVNASAAAAFNTPMLSTSEQAVVNGALTGRGGMALSNENGGGDVASIAGTIRVERDVVASGISLVGHIHDGDSGGQTSPPKR